MFWKKAKKEAPHDLAGRWTVDPSDGATVNELGDVVLQFGDDGMLTYTISLPDKDQIILLSYRLEGSVIVSNQPSHPNEQRSEFEANGDKLMVMFGGQRSRFVRA